jgi:nicotinate-nucleotide pyrophosphorylase (carboxylating)
MKMNWNNPQLNESVRHWLIEDIGYADLTSESTIDPHLTGKGIIHMKAHGIVAGLPLVEKVFHTVDPSLRLVINHEDGTEALIGQTIAEVHGAMQSILKGERLALNLLQRLSGIATKTRRFVSLVQDLPVRIVDTRKTTPGLRGLEKYAVRMGGGHNHRFGLYDAIMIKDNHIKAAGGISRAVERAKQYSPHTVKIEVEVENLIQLQEALSSGVDIIMLDNMSRTMMREAVQMIRQYPNVVTEASGGVNEETVRAIAETGVDVISIGGLTHSVSALDISLDLTERKGRPE